MIQLHRLEGFYWVARVGGYARAARAFPYPITQPAVHQQVKKLETELGLQLFERVGKDRMTLTPAGKHLYDFVVPFFAELPAVLRSIQGGEYGGTLRVSAPALVLRNLMPAWIKRLRKRIPELEIELFERSSADLDALLCGDYDVVVDHLPEPPDDVAELRVGTLRGFLVLPAGHALARRKRVTISDLAGETFVSYNRDLLPYQLQMKALAAHGVSPRNTLSASSADTILGFVESGLGYSLVPSLNESGPKAKGIVALPLTSPRVEFPVVAAWRKNTPENLLLDAFLESAPG